MLMVTAAAVVFLVLVLHPLRLLRLLPPVVLVLVLVLVQFLGRREHLARVFATVVALVALAVRCWRVRLEAGDRSASRAALALSRFRFASSRVRGTAPGARGLSCTARDAVRRSEELLIDSIRS